jgi:hypothetical protein
MMQRSTYRLIFVLAIPVALATCITPFDPPEGNYQGLLVVEGLITDKEETYVKLSNSIPIDTLYINPEHGARVTITDEDGEEVVLEEIHPGYYTVPEHLAFEPHPGTEYVLECVLTDGDVVRSRPVTMRTTPDIDSVHWRWKAQPVVGGSEFGVEILVTTNDPSGRAEYYQWEWHETWQFTSAFRSVWVYSDDEVLPRTEDIYTCWADRTSTNIIIGTSTNLSADIIYARPVHFVSAESSDRLRYRYSILVRQRSLDEASYAFWENLKEINESTGSLFDVQPGQVLGNLYAVNNPSRVVLGYFDAAQTKEKRLFISRSELPQIMVPAGYNYCEVDTLLLQDMPDWNPAGFLLVLDLYGMTGELMGYSYSYERCVDCRYRGTNQKPDFW